MKDDLIVTTAAKEGWNNANVISGFISEKIIKAQ